jgi:hypothetical protein
LTKSLNIGSIYERTNRYNYNQLLNGHVNKLFHPVDYSTNWSYPYVNDHQGDAFQKYYEIDVINGEDVTRNAIIGKWESNDWYCRGKLGLCTRNYWLKERKSDQAWADDVEFQTVYKIDADYLNKSGQLLEPGEHVFDGRHAIGRWKNYNWYYDRATGWSSNTYYYQTRNQLEKPGSYN